MGGVYETAGAVEIFQGGKRPADDLPLCYCAANKAHTDTEGQNALYGAAVEGHKHFLREMVLPDDLQEVESLLCFLNHYCSVSAPGQVFLYLRLCTAM